MFPLKALPFSVSSDTTIFLKMLFCQLIKRVFLGIDRSETRFFLWVHVTSPYSTSSISFLAL